MTYCRNCGKEVSPKAIACPACGVPPRIERNFCPSCGKNTTAAQIMCVGCGATLGSATPSNVGGQSKRMVAGLLALFLGGFGVHKFYLGYNNAGALMLGGWFVSFILAFVLIGFLGFAALGIIALIEAITYLTKTDEEFDQIYVIGKKEWF